jgi:BirA family biotin operon repressor/biotin-[acetyl-CoA-carboxylase] ligase
MPLTAKYTISLTMMDFGVMGVRLRWPNDVMVNSRKCAGILVDRFHPDRCVVGMGINVFNDPSAENKKLKGQTTRLKDLTSLCPSVHVVIAHVLANLRQIMVFVDHYGASGLIRRLRPLWKIPSRVAVKSVDGEKNYDFLGVDDEGRVLLKSTAGSIQAYAPEEIEMFREIQEVP